MDLPLESRGPRHCFCQFADRQINARAHIEKRKVVWSRLDVLQATSTRQMAEPVMPMRPAP